MDARRMRFAAALVVFLLWVGALAALAVVSARAPRADGPAAGAARG